MLHTILLFSSFQCEPTYINMYIFHRLVELLSFLLQLSSERQELGSKQASRKQNEAEE